MRISQLLTLMGLALSVALLAACAHDPAVYPCGDPRAGSWCARTDLPVEPAPTISACVDTGGGFISCF